MAQDLFKKTLQDYLESRAASDSLFAKSFAKSNKNINDCASYVINRAHKDGREGIAQAEVFGWAVHYYDEDSIDVGKHRNCNVVVATDETQSTKKAVPAKAVAPQAAKVSTAQTKITDCQTVLFDF